MSTLILQNVGAAIGGLFGPIGAIAGRAIGALAGSAIDQAIFSDPARPTGRIGTARLAGPDEGTAITRLYGTERIGGTLIWATRFEEALVSERQGGKGFGPRAETYTYSANLAFGLCQGPIAGIRRIFADGRELNLEGIEYRIHTGSETQLPDPLIEAKQGTGKAPAYRGLAYVVFEGLPLKPFGNRIPLLQFEVIRPVGALERQIRAITLIPGATEHGYDPGVVSEELGAGQSRYLNRNTLSGKSDWSTSLDELQALCPNLRSVALVVSWFGTDLNLASSAITPGVELRQRNAESSGWSVSGLDRTTARLVSRVNGSPAYGGTPSDQSVVAAIADLKARGLNVFLYPFLLMDIPPGNGLVDPYGGPAQAAFPWRGRITCAPAPGRPGSPDRTAAIRTAVNAFCGTATPADFAVNGTTVAYTGTGGGFLRMILHYALLAKAAGGVDGFILGSELRGLTTLRDETGAFPFVARLVGLATTVKSILGAATRLTYAADWSEYFGYQPADGSGDVFFHLDPLWASPAIDAVGIDNYLPLADFRDGDLSAPNPDGFRHQEDPAGLMAGITAGERFTWYYASDADRTARIRTPITDGTASKPWVFAPKDIAGWWSNPHVERRGGVELTKPTAWTPKMKPVWFTELGCPAIDRGANQPNVFLDPKSAESHAPWFSRRYRADSAQRRFLEAHLRWWSSSSAPAGMVATDRIFVWCWDTRPFPAFPRASRIWSDGANWQTGHWLNGRLGAGTVADVLAAILTDHGFTAFDVSGVTGDITGYVGAEIGSARTLIEPLLHAFQIDVVEEGALLRFTSRLETSLPVRALDVLADDEKEPLYEETRGKLSEFADQTLITFDDPALDYQTAIARSPRLSITRERLLQLGLPGALDFGQAVRLAEALLRDHQLQRRSVTFRLSPGEIGLQPGDVISLPSGPPGRFLVVRIEDGAGRRVEAREFVPAVLGVLSAPTPEKAPAAPPEAVFAPDIALLDLPQIDNGPSGSFARAAGLMKPWRPIQISSSASTEGYVPRALLDRPARMGRLVQALAPGRVRGRFDHARLLLVALDFGGFASATPREVLDGANRLAIEASPGRWEVLAFTKATEITPGTFQLSGLLCGLFGTEDAMAAGAAAGARVVALDAAVKPLDVTGIDTGVSRNFIAEGLGRIGGQVGPIAFAPGQRAQTPLSPVHLKARRQADLSILFKWTRRGRIDADTWTAIDIPADEAVEAWKIDFLAADKVTVLRTVRTTQASCLYPAAQELADYGARQVAITIRVRQVGRLVPAGLPQTDTLHP
nr:glycoside hydrolase/phage tail family protein [uncultured Gellertiella sp.]